MFHDVERHLNAFSGNSKKRFERGRGSDVLSRRMALRTHNLPPGRLKNDFGEVDEAMFHGVESPNELIFCILSIEKSDLDEVA
jgi:hypothetical protein